MRISPYGAYGINFYSTQLNTQPHFSGGDDSSDYERPRRRSQVNQSDKPKEKLPITRVQLEGTSISSEESATGRPFGGRAKKIKNKDLPKSFKNSW